MTPEQITDLSTKFTGTDAIAVGVIVIGAYAVIWGIKRAIGMSKS